MKALRDVLEKAQSVLEGKEEEWEILYPVRPRSKGVAISYTYVPWMKSWVLAGNFLNTDDSLTTISLYSANYKSKELARKAAAEFSAFVKRKHPDLKTLIKYSRDMRNKESK